MVRMTLDEERPLGPAVRRGWRRRCPACGEGRLMHSYLKVYDRCPVCNEALFHHRADDGPAYLTILLVGHLVAPLLLFSYTKFQPEPWILASVLSIAVVALSLYLLPHIKGVIVAIQWAKKMHGFGADATPESVIRPDLNHPPGART